MAGKRTTVNERFHLERVPQDPQQLQGILQENEDYTLSAEQLIDTDHEGERIYQLVVPIDEISLSGDGIPEGFSRKNGAGEAAPENSSETEEPGDSGETGDPDAAAQPDEHVETAQEGGSPEAASNEGEQASSSKSPAKENAKNAKENAKNVKEQEKQPADSPDGIWVYADGVRIGRIKATDRLHVRNLFQNYKITGLEADVHGGPYRIVRQDEEEKPCEEAADARWAADLTVYYRVPRYSGEIASDISAREQIAAMIAALGERNLSNAGAGGRAVYSGFSGESPVASSIGAGSGPAPSAQGAAAQPEGDEDTGDRWGIDTSYDTIRKEKDPAGRGLFFLLIAAVYATFYLCFSVPGWIPSLSTGISRINLFGFEIAGIPGYVPGGMMIAGLLCNIISMFTGGGVLPIAASLLYLLAGFTAPSCLLFTAIPAVLCIFGALRKKKGSAALRNILALLAAAAAAFLLYQHFSGKVYFEPFQARELTDWDSLIAFVNGDPSFEGTGARGQDELTGLEYETDEDGTVYYEDGVYYEDESEWYEEESDWWEEESDWWEDESGYVVWEELESESETETETETEGNGETRVFGDEGSAGLN